MTVDSAQTAKDKGNVAFRSGDYPVAVGHYTSAILADAQNPTFYLNRAAAYLKLGKFEDAESDCSTVLSLEPRNVKGWFRRGQARVGVENLNEARADFHRVLSLEPSNPSAKQELKSVENLLKINENKRGMVTSMGSRAYPTNTVPPLVSSISLKRRRVPITVVEIGSQVSLATPGPSSSTVGPAETMRPISTRVLNHTTVAAPFPTGSPPSVSCSSLNVSQDFPTAPLPRVGGGIFRANGKHTIFAAHSKEHASVPSSSPGSKQDYADFRADVGLQSTMPHRSDKMVKSSMGFLAFSKMWDTLLSWQQRWEFLQKIPPDSLPSLFQASLDPSTLTSLVETFSAVLQHSSSASLQETKAMVREYVIHLPRVARWNTILLFLGRDERQLISNIWDGLAGDDTDLEAKRRWGVTRPQ